MLLTKIKLTSNLSGIKKLICLLKSDKSFKNTYILTPSLINYESNNDKTLNLTINVDKPDDIVYPDLKGHVDRY